MIIEKFFPTLVYGKDVQLDNNQLTQDIINWSRQDKGVSKTNYKGWHSTTDMRKKPEYSTLVTELFRMQKEKNCIRRRITIIWTYCKIEKDWL